MKDNVSNGMNRRKFIKGTFSSCAFCCLTATNLFGSEQELRQLAMNQPHKFNTDAGMTMQEVYDFAFGLCFIPAMKNLMKQIGKEQFLAMLRQSSEMLYENEKEADTNYSERTLIAFTNQLKEAANDFYKLRNTLDFIYCDEHILEMNTTECLLAKTFREADAADIGYACFCYQDYPYAKAYNPKLKFYREKTLMQGHEYCQNKWVMET